MSDKWKIRFIILIALLIGYWVGVRAERYDLWFYSGPDSAKCDSAMISFYTGD